MRGSTVWLFGTCPRMPCIEVEGRVTRDCTMQSTQQVEADTNGAQSVDAYESSYIAPPCTQLLTNQTCLRQARHHHCHRMMACRYPDPI